MTSKRTPLNRQLHRRVTAEAVAAFRISEQHRDRYLDCVEGVVKCTRATHCDECRDYLIAHRTLNQALHLKPWETVEDKPALLEELQAAAGGE